MAERGIGFTEVDVSQDRASAEKLYQVSGQLAVPVITVGDEVIVGFNQERLDQLLVTKQKT